MNMKWDVERFIGMEESFAKKIVKNPPKAILTVGWFCKLFTIPIMDIIAIEGFLQKQTLQKAPTY